MAERNIRYCDLWLIYKSSDQYKDQILHWLNLEKHLPIYTPDMQLEVLEGAPTDIIKRVAKHLDPRAAQKLGLTVAKPKQKPKQWRNRALL